MKKIKILIIFLLIFLLNVNHACAIVLKPSGKVNGIIGEEITIYITLENNDKNVSAVDGSLNYDNNIFSLVSSSNLMKNWTELSSISNNNIFSYANLTFDNLITNSNKNIAEVVLKIKNNSKSGDTVIKIDNPNATDENGNGLLIEGGEHHINIKSNINSLSNLSLSAGNINFNKDILNYNLTVSNEIKSININASLTDNKSSFVDGFEPRTINLSVGDNIIKIKIKAENGEIKTYTINITRENKKNTKDENNQNNENNQTNGNNTKSSNNYLSYLKPSYGTIIFDKRVSEYVITIPNNLNEINFDLKAEDSKATTKIEGNKNLKVGENTVIITITSEDGNTRQYKILVTKKDKNIVLSNNSKLKKLIIKEYDIDFNSNKYIYNIKIKDEKNLDITYIKEDEKSNVTITGNDDLKNNSIINITVVAEDGSSSSYNINIKKNISINTILLGIIIILIIVLIVVIIINSLLQKRKIKNKS